MANGGGTRIGEWRDFFARFGGEYAGTVASVNLNLLIPMTKPFLIALIQTSSSTINVCVHLAYGYSYVRWDVRTTAHDLHYWT